MDQVPVLTPHTMVNMLVATEEITMEQVKKNSKTYYSYKYLIKPFEKLTFGRKRD